MTKVRREITKKETKIIVTVPDAEINVEYLYQAIIHVVEAFNVKSEKEHDLHNS